MWVQSGKEREGEIEYQDGREGREGMEGKWREGLECVVVRMGKCHEREGWCGYEKQKVESKPNCFVDKSPLQL